MDTTESVCFCSQRFLLCGRCLRCLFLFLKLGGPYCKAHNVSDYPILVLLRGIFKPWATSAAVGKSFCTLPPIRDADAFEWVQAGFPVLSFLPMDPSVSVDARSCGCMTLPMGTSCGTTLPVTGGGTGVGFGFVAIEGVCAMDELVEDGRDHPGPVVVER